MIFNSDKMIKNFILLLFLSISSLAYSIDKEKPKKKDELVIIHTAFGDMTVLLYEETPLHKANFLRLAKAGIYDSASWHRVIRDFMVQGGDVTKKAEAKDFQLEEVPAEIVDQYFHEKGALAAARQGDQVNPERKSSSCQFYIVHGKKFESDELTIDRNKLQRGISLLLNDSGADTIRQQFQEIAKTGDGERLDSLAISYADLINEKFDLNVEKEISPEALKAYTSLGGSPHLDGAYTVFGKVVSGLAIIDELASVQTGRRDKPVEDIYMTMEVISMKTKTITKNYGYVYPPIKRK